MEMQVRQEPATGLVMGVGNIIPRCGALPRDLADARHGEPLLNQWFDAAHAAKGALLNQSQRPEARHRAKIVAAGGSAQGL
jgi:hypothetical protein